MVRTITTRICVSAMGAVDVSGQHYARVSWDYTLARSAANRHVPHTDIMMSRNRAGGTLQFMCTMSMADTHGRVIRIAVAN
jgi:hypothetical protein